MAQQVSLQDLKRHLARWIGLAAAGETIEVTRYRRPIARLGPADVGGLHVGAEVGRWQLRPLPGLRGGTRALEILEEDRGAESEER
jgi:antitoxin (DNA-binding transcriptional repressor) of toxin-antitoxin stability system